jgi:hypothetical protein
MPIIRRANSEACRRADRKKRECGALLSAAELHVNVSGVGV